MDQLYRQLVPGSIALWTTIGLCLLAHTALAAKLLFIPFAASSHIMYFKTPAQQLQSRGHEVHFLLSPSYPGFAKLQEEFPTLGHHLPEKDLYSSNLTEEEEKTLFLDIIKMGPVEDFRVNIEPFRPLCDNALSDENLFNQVKNNKYDMAMVDAFPGSRCMYILLYRLNIPYVSLTTQYEPWLFRNPSLPSFVPNTLGTTYSEKMNFWERLDNLWVNLRWYLLIVPNIAYLKDELVTRYAPEKEPVSLNTLAGRSLLWFLNSDVTIDYPRPTMPNVIEVGGLTLKKTQPLAADLQKFMDSAKHGVIIVSFGTLARYLPDETMDKLYKVFLQIEQCVVWRYVNKHLPQNIPKRIKLLKWLPQDALLAHPNTKLFITHAGNNGQFEGMYFGIPMLNMPIFGDQPYNARRAVYKGFGLAADVLSFTLDELQSKIKELIKNPKYKKKVQKASQIYRDRPKPAIQRIVWWIEHVLKYGGQHLRSYALDMPWYQYLMLDILGFLLLILTVIVVLFWLACTAICRIICRGKKSEKLKQS